MKNPKKEEILRVKREALKLYLEGIGRDHICKKLGMFHSTFDRWKQKGDWAKLYKDNEAKVIEKISTDIADEKARSLKLIRGAESLFARKLNDGELDANLSSFAQLQRVKWEILMPRTVSQYNFLKQENNTGPKFSLEIVNPNDENKDQVETKPEAVRSVEDTPEQEDN